MSGGEKNTHGPPHGPGALVSLAPTEALIFKRGQGRLPCKIDRRARALGLCRGRVLSVDIFFKWKHFFLEPAVLTRTGVGGPIPFTRNPGITDMGL
jgi:hypothetical protein